MTTFTEQDIAALQGLTGLSADAQCLVNRAVIDAQMGIDRDNAPKVFRSQTITLFVEYENEDASGTQRLVVFQADPNDDVKSIADMVEAHHTAVETTFPATMRRVVGNLTPREVKPV